MKHPLRTRIAYACAVCAAALTMGAGAADGASALDGPDSEAPRGAVGGFRSPASGTLELAITASDGGAGLATATATVDGRPAGEARLGPESCGAPAADGQPAGVPCPATVSAVALAVDLTPYAAGRHRLQVSIADAAGNSALILDEALDAAGPPPVYAASVTLQIGDGASSPPAGTNASKTAATRTPACRAPRLSMTLDQRPLRVTRTAVAVLRSAMRYRFRGRLTCRVNLRRRGAPAGIAVSLVNRFGPGGRRVLRKTGLVTRGSGRLTLVVAYRSSRTLAFRYSSADGTTTRVQIPIIVAKAAPRARAKR